MKGARGSISQQATVKAYITPMKKTMKTTMKKGSPMKKMTTPLHKDSAFVLEAIRRALEHRTIHRLCAQALEVRPSSPPFLRLPPSSQHAPCSRLAPTSLLISLFPVPPRFSTV